MFESFPKIPRLYRDCVITEKLDGTNAQVVIASPPVTDGEVMELDEYCLGSYLGYNIYAGSRKRLITPDNDNFGFAAWVQEHGAELIAGLGEGRHYGEWWGQGIQRGYDLDERRFSLFNVNRWNKENIPTCCEVVPLLYIGNFNTQVIDLVKRVLVDEGSAAAPGYMNPEGVVVYHTAANQLFKSLLDNDDQTKGTSE